MATYVWTGAGDGTSWSDPKNWNNTSAGENPATSAPSGGDNVTFGNATIDDSGSADYVTVTSLTIDGGSVKATYFVVNGALSITDGGTASADGQPLVSIDVAGGSISVDGNGSSLTANTLYFFSGPFDVKDGASVTVSESNPAIVALALGQGSNVVTTIDGSGSTLTETGGNVTLGYQSTSSLNITDGATANFSESNAAYPSFHYRQRWNCDHDRRWQRLEPDHNGRLCNPRYKWRQWNA